MGAYAPDRRKTRSLAAMTMEEQAMKILTRLRARVLGRWVPQGEEGAVMSEYVVLVGVVSLSLATSIAALGPVLFASYERARGILICPIP